MSGWINHIVGLIRSQLISRRAVRAESFAVGGRHLGDVLKGSREELQHPDLEPKRRALLIAVERHARSGRGWTA